MRCATRPVLCNTPPAVCNNSRASPRGRGVWFWMRSATVDPRAFGRNSQSQAIAPEPGGSLGAAIRELRVFYEVASDEGDVVRILAVGRKRGNKVIIDGRELEL